MTNLIAERFDVYLDHAARLVDDLIPIEAYDEHEEVPAEDVEIWLTYIAKEID